MSATLTPLQKLTQSFHSWSATTSLPAKSPVMRSLDSYAKSNASVRVDVTQPLVSTPNALPFNFATCTIGIADTEDDARELNLCSLKQTSRFAAKGFAEKAKTASSIVAGAIGGCTALPGSALPGFEREFYTAMESAAVECKVVDAALIAWGLGTVVVGGEITIGSLGASSAATVPAIAVGAAAAGAGAAMAPLHEAMFDRARANKALESRRIDAQPTEFVADKPVRGVTHESSAWYRSEREARAEARKKLGRAPVEVEPGKLRSWDGRWQYRAKPGDVAARHIHLEKLDPTSGEVLTNLHLRW